MKNRKGFPLLSGLWHLDKNSHSLLNKNKFPNQKTLLQSLFMTKKLISIFVTSNDKTDFCLKNLESKI